MLRPEVPATKSVDAYRQLLSPVSEDRMALVANRRLVGIFQLRNEFFLYSADRWPWEGWSSASLDSSFETILSCEEKRLGEMGSFRSAVHPIVARGRITSVKTKIKL